MMKILQETTDTQTLKILPRSYPSLVDVEITNEDTKEVTLLEDLEPTTVGAYMEIDYAFDLKEDTFYNFKVLEKVSDVVGVKCIAGNNEYMSSPAGSYITGNINDIDLDIDYSGYSDTIDTNLITYGDFVSGNDSFVFFLQDSKIGITILNSGVTPNILTDILTIPVNGNIKVLGDGTNVIILLDDVEVYNTPHDWMFSNPIITPLVFGAWLLAISYSNIAFSYIKINDHEWTFPEGSGSTTTSSEGTITTLHSDVSTDAMWVGEKVQGETIHKGKIFCTNQEYYSIQNGEYIAQDRDDTYITR